MRMLSHVREDTQASLRRLLGALVDALELEHLASNSSSSDSQRRNQSRASAAFGVPNQSRFSTFSNQVQIFSNSMRISSASS